jgi:hypothetical protein
MATRRNRNQRSRRNRNQRNRNQSQRNRRGGAEDYELNVRNCQRYYHPTNPSFCTSKAPGGDATAAQGINYPGIANQMRGAVPTVKMGRNKGEPVPKGYY